MLGRVRAERSLNAVVAASLAVAGLLAVVAIVLALEVENPTYTIASVVLMALAAGFGASRAIALHAVSQEAEMDARRRSELLEMQVRRQRAAIDALADGLDIAIFLCDQSGVIEYANRKAVELFRFDEPSGRSILAVTLSHDLERLVSTAATMRQAQAAELTFRNPDERIGLARAWPEPPEANRVFLSIYEITNLRRLERVRRDFVANVSHELRTPMTTIRAMAETLLDEIAETEQPDALQQRYLTKIVQEVDRLSLISDDLLTLSSAESNPVVREICDLAEIVHGVAIQLESKAHESGLELELDSPRSLKVSAEPNQMAQVAMNLIDNAIKYTPKGRVRVRVYREGPLAAIEVSDTGLGISSDQVGRIFERFYRVDKARSRAGGGTGLGLAIVKHICEAHGGRVEVESELNKGSTFRAWIPIGD